MFCRIPLILLSLFALLSPGVVLAERNSKLRFKLEASAVDSSVKLTIISPSKKHRRISLQVERNDGNGFFMLAEIAQPKRKEVVFDNSVPKGFHSYRVRLQRKEKEALISQEADVSFENVSDGYPEDQTSTGLEAKSPISPQSCKLAELPEGLYECPIGYIENIILSVNEERKIAGAPPVTNHPLLNCSSRLHTIQMITAGKLGHDGWYDSIKQSGYTGRAAGQNVAYGFPDTQQLMSGWMNSPGHKSNILSTNFTYIGVSCLMQNNIMWWTQDFGG